MKTRVSESKMSETIMSSLVEKRIDKKPRTASGNQLMTPEQCAAFLQIEVNTLYVMKSRGRIPYRKVGHLLRFDFDEIVEWTKPKDR
jgi:excisionase family DNA binding protein